LAVTLPSSIQHAGWLWPLRYVGEISYGIYLWHLPVLLTLMTLPGFTGMRLFTGVLAGTFILSACSWHLMEKPLIDRWKSSPPH
jgi:peptidoglycan/LPS O-acetylase OafA/YrhL